MGRLKSFVRKNLFGIVTLCLSILMLSYGIFVTGGFSELVIILRRADVFWITVVFLSICAFWLLDGALLFIAAKKDYRAYSFGKAFKTAVIGLFYNAVTPFASGGQPLQVFDMTKAGIDAGDAGSYIMIKTIIYQICLTISSVAAVIYCYGAFAEAIQSFSFFIVLGITLNSVFIAAIIFLCSNKNIIDKVVVKIICLMDKLHLIKDVEAAYEKTNQQVSLFYTSFLLLRKEKLLMLKLFTISGVQIMVFLSIPYFIYRSFHLHGAQLVDIAATQAIISVITAFVPTPGATGAAEGSFYLFYRLFFEGGTVMAAMLLWRIATYYSCIFGGCAISLLQILADKSYKDKNLIIKRERFYHGFFRSGKRYD